MKKNKSGINKQTLIMKVIFGIVLAGVIAILYSTGKDVVKPYERFTTTWFNIILAGWKSLDEGGKFITAWFGGISLLAIFLGKPVPTAKQNLKNPDTPIFPDTPVPVKNAADCVECHDEGSSYFPAAGSSSISSSYDYGMQERRSAHEYEHQLKQLESQLESGLITKEEYRELKARYKS